MYEALIHKYTGKQIDMIALAKSNRKMAWSLNRAASRLDSTEKDLARQADRLIEVAEKIRKNLQAGPGDQVYSLNVLGELQSDRTDRLIAIRDQQMEQLQMLVGLLPE